MAYVWKRQLGMEDGCLCGLLFIACLFDASQVTEVCFSVFEIGLGFHSSGGRIIAEVKCMF